MHFESPAAPPLASLQAMDPEQARRPFTNAQWAFQLITGGYRMLADFGAGSCRLHSRGHVDTTSWFPEAADALVRLPVGRTVLDGEICVLDAAGRNDAQRLHQRALSPGLRAGSSPVVFCVQDLLIHEGEDLRSMPWRERRSLLHALPLGDLPAVRLQRALDGRGEWLYGQAVALGRPGILAKRRDAPYRGGRCADWLVISCPPDRAAVPA